MLSLLKKFTTHSQNALEKATEFAVSDRDKTIRPDHLLRAISEEKGSLGANILKMNNISLPIKKNKVKTEKYSKSTKIKSEGLKFSEEIINVFEKALSQAMRFNQPYIGTEHLLFGILCQENISLEQKTVRKILNRMEEIFFASKKFEMLKNTFQKGELLETISDNRTHTDQAPIKNQIGRRKNLTNKKTINDMEKNLKQLEKKLNNIAGDIFPEENKRGQEKEKSPNILPPKLFPTVLDFFCVNLVEEARNNKFDPMIGRETEINRICRVLMRRTKNNPILIGGAGVGKTAIVQGLAQKIADGSAPQQLLNKTILSLDMGVLSAGASFRGEFEARLKDIAEEAKKRKAIIFIDEIHTIVGTGSGGTMDAANILKPLLSAGEIQCIGATTYEEYKKHIEKDKALARRFQPIQIKEASEEETIETLKGIKEKLEGHHKIKISEEAIKESAKLSAKYIKDRFFPDKAIDTLDEAASKMRMEQKDENKKRLSLLRRDLDNTTTQKEEAVLKENFDKAAELKNKEESILREIDNLYEKISKQKPKIRELKGENIIETISEITGIPPSKIDESGAKKLLTLEKKLKEKIIGQNAAVRKITKAVFRSHIGLSSEQRPLASFMFLGPSGVGKTETAKTLAGEMFGENSFIKLDMSEFTEPHSVSRLIGSPPGYVGYDEGGQLTEKVKRNPYSLILFDEIEKAHPLVHNLLLQILDDGVLYDNFSGPINFRNTVIIITTNIGGFSSGRKKKEIGFQTGKNKEEDKEKEADKKIKEKALRILRQRMRPELLNRLNEIIVFDKLGEKELVDIAKARIIRLKEKLKEQYGFNLKFGDDVALLIAKIAAKKEGGARAINYTIEELIESPIAEKIVSGKTKKTISLKIEKEKVRVID